MDSLYTNSYSLNWHIFNEAGQQVKMDNPADDEQLFG